jgi:hypothetical protein
MTVSQLLKIQTRGLGRLIIIGGVEISVYTHHE